MSQRIFKKIRVTTSVVAIALCLTGAAVANKRVQAYDIKAQDTAHALTDFAQQAGVQILFPADVAAKFRAPAIKGDFTRQEILEKLLAGTGLEVASASETVIVLKVSPKSADAEAPVEVIVTGSHVRTAKPTSPVRVIGSEDIVRSGYTEIGDVFRALPENFAGGQNPGVRAASAASDDNGNVTGASTINIRGLGSDASLLLVNGNRLAAEGFNQATDISGVPLSAVARVEIVTDGASALYGADAVAGVANIILRRNFQGVQTGVSLGGSTQGGSDDQTYSVLAGMRRDTWYAMINVERSERDPLYASKRAFTSAATPETTLFPGQNRTSVFVSAGVDVSPSISLTLDALVGNRITESTFKPRSTSALLLNRVSSPSHSVALGLDIALASDWKLNLSGVVSGTKNRNAFDYPAFNYKGKDFYRNELESLDAKADGTLITLPSGEVKVAIGGGVRTETYTQGYPADPTFRKGSRDIVYIFTEAYAPLVAPDATRRGLEELDVSLSLRSERYSDFGDSTVPKLGLRYVPFHGLVVRGTWGKSFKAPRLVQLHQIAAINIYSAGDMGLKINGVPSTGAAFSLAGGNPNLGPEKSTSYTFGLDYRPDFLARSRFSLTKFSIDYTGRVVRPAINQTTAFSDPTLSTWVELNPSAARQADLIANSDQFTNRTGIPYTPANVVAVFHNRYINAASQTVEGFDLSYSQDFDLLSGNLSLYANGSWQEMRRRNLPSVPEKTLSGTIFNMPEFKARGGATWQRGGLSASAIINHIDGTTDIGTTPVVAVGSWTTWDATLSYRVQSSDGPLKGVRVSLSASNLFDRDPPRALSPALEYPGYYFDSTNSSVMGRYVTASLTKEW